MLKTEFAFFAVWARAFPFSDGATFHSPTSFVKPLAISPVASLSKFQVFLASSPAWSGATIKAASARPVPTAFETLMTPLLGTGEGNGGRTGRTAFHPAGS